MSTANFQRPALIEHSGQNLVLWQDYLGLCAGSRSPACAAAIFDLLEQYTINRLQTRNAVSWIPLTYEDIYHALFENYWLQNIKGNIKWLQSVNYIEWRLHPKDEGAIHAFRLNVEVIQKAIQSIT